MGGGLEDNIAGGDEVDNNQDTEIQDRKLVCMVRRNNQQGVDVCSIKITMNTCNSRAWTSVFSTD